MASPGFAPDRRISRPVSTQPIIDTSITHRKAGFGMIGAGLVHPPMECFTKALQAFAARYGRGGS